MSNSLEVMTKINSQCSILDHVGKPIVSLALEQAIGKLVFNENLSIT